MLRKDKGICIRTTDYSETSQILTFFTADTGKLSVIAKGAKRPKSSFGGPIELLTAGDMVFSVKDSEKLGTLTEFNPTFLGFTLRKKLFALNCALFTAELLNLFTKELDPHPSIFDAAIILLRTLDKDPDNQALSKLILFEFTLLEETGSSPVFDRCINCKRDFDANWKQYYFAVSDNGIVCRDCEAAFVDKRVISRETAAYLNKSDNIPQADWGVLVSIQNLLIEYITHILERPPRTAVTILKLINSKKQI
ncbi:MAG: DNA repair protein RecO [Sedimentisphaerales bacterium]|nr:DNA repair protein RecO [Sedimentisphaerales bacterium]